MGHKCNYFTEAPSINVPLHFWPGTFVLFVFDFLFSMYFISFLVAMAAAAAAATICHSVHCVVSIIKRFLVCCYWCYCFRAHTHKLLLLCCRGCPERDVSVKLGRKCNLLCAFLVPNSLYIASFHKIEAVKASENNVMCGAVRRREKQNLLFFEFNFARDYL